MKFGKLFDKTVPTAEELKDAISADTLFRCRCDYDDMLCFSAKSLVEEKCLFILILRMLEVDFEGCTEEQAAEIVKESWLSQLLPRERKYLIYEAFYLEKRQKILKLAFPNDYGDFTIEDLAKADMFRHSYLSDVIEEEDVGEDARVLLQSRQILRELLKNATEAFSS